MAFVKRKEFLSRRVEVWEEWCPDPVQDIARTEWHARWSLCWDLCETAFAPPLTKVILYHKVLLVEGIAAPANDKYSMINFVIGAHDFALSLHVSIINRTIVVKLKYWRACTDFSDARAFFEKQFDRICIAILHPDQGGRQSVFINPIILPFI